MNLDRFSQDIGYVAPPDRHDPDAEREPQAATVCAWCDQEAGVKRAPGTSHGICPRHARAMLRQVNE